MNNKLNFKTLLLTGLGMAIGANVMTYVGVLTGVNGRAAILTVIICLILGLGCVAPYFMLTCLTSIKGSYYSIAKEGLGLTVGGVCQYMSIADLLFYVSYPISVANYITSLCPGLNKVAVSVIFMILVYLVCVSGMKIFARIQSVCTVVMLVMLAIFVVFGVVYMVNAGAQPFDFVSAPDFSMDMVLSGVPIIIFYSYGYGNMFFYSSMSEKPTKNIPKAMVIVGAITIATWIFVTLISTNTLPMEQTAGQPLTYIAQEILPQPLAYVFVIGGAMLAVITSYLGLLPGAAVGYKQAAKEGWFPKGLGKENRFGAPWVIYLFIMAIAFILIVLGIPLSTILLEVALLDAIWIGTIAVSFLCMPKKHPELFANSKRITPGMFYVAAAIALAINVYIFYLSVNSLPIQVVVVSLVAIVIFAIISRLRVVKNKIHTENNFEILND